MKLEHFCELKIGDEVEVTDGTIGPVQRFGTGGVYKKIVYTKWRKAARYIKVNEEWYCPIAVIRKVNDRVAPARMRLWVLFQSAVDAPGAMEMQIIKAPNEPQAREIASKSDASCSSHTWKDLKLSRCDVVRMEGEPEVICQREIERYDSFS